MLTQNTEKIDDAVTEVSLFYYSIDKDLRLAGFYLGLAVEIFIEWLIDENEIKFDFDRPTVQEQVKQLQKCNIIEKHIAENLISCYSWRGNAIHRKPVDDKQARYFYRLIKDITWHYRASSKNLN